MLRSVAKEPNFLGGKRSLFPQEFRKDSTPQEIGDLEGSPENYDSTKELV